MPINIAVLTKIFLKGVGEAIVTIIDINDNVPLFDQIRYETEVSENLPFNNRVLQVHADDPDADENGEVVYSILESVKVSYF